MGKEELQETLDKIYFRPGDVVMVRHDIEHRPRMVVKSKSTFVLDTKVVSTIPNKQAVHFHGMTCYWFSSQGEYMEKTFNTKDLIHV